MFVLCRVQRFCFVLRERGCRCRCLPDRVDLSGSDVLYLPRELTSLLVVGLCVCVFFFVF